MTNHYVAHVTNEIDISETTAQFWNTQAVVVPTGKTGTGISPLAYYVRTTVDAVTTDTTITIADNIQYMGVDTVLYFVSDPLNMSIVLTADAQVGDTSLSVAPLSDDIPAGSAGSGTQMPFHLARMAGPMGLGPGTGTAPATGVPNGGIQSLVQHSLRFPNPTLGSAGYPVQGAGSILTPGGDTPPPPPPPTAPAVDAVSPATGSTSGGTTVHITGGQFVNVTSVTFGGTPAASFTVNSANSITAVAPTGASTVNVVVTTATGTSPTSGATQFSYGAVPTISGLSPSSGPIGGGTSITISGSNFTGATQVLFGGVSANSFVVNNANSITAVTRAAANSVVDVRVTNSAGQSATSGADHFTYGTGGAGGGGGGGGGGGNYATEVLADSPEVYWRLGEPSGSTAVDASGNGNTGTYIASPTLGRPGLVSGDADTAIVLATQSPQPGGYGMSTATFAGPYPLFSFEAIVKFPSVGPNGESYNFSPIFAFGDQTGLYSYNPSGGFQILWNTPTNGFISSPNIAYNTADVYHHIVAVFDGTNSVLYLDGAVVDTTAKPEGIALSSPQNMFVGNIYGSIQQTASPGSDPIIDEAVFYDSALSAGDVSAHYAAFTGTGFAAAVLANSPLVYYRLGEPSGTTMTDSSGNGFHGQYFNSPTLGVAGALDDASTAVQINSPFTPIQGVSSVGTFGPMLMPNFTYEAIINLATLTTFDYPVMMSLAAWSNYDYIEMWCHDDGSGNIFLALGADSIAGYWEVDSAPGAITLNTTYHVAGTWDGSTARLYINGTEVGSTSSSEVIQLGQADHLYVGDDIYIENFDGTIDEAAFYLTTLDPARIAAHSTAAGLVGGGGGGGTGTGAILHPQTTWAAVGRAPLSDAAAAALITRQTEVRSGNVAANSYVPTTAEQNAFFNSLDDNGDTPAAVYPYYAFVTGTPGISNPSTDDLIQWAAHKWGIPEDWIRAEMVDETNWFQNGLGDRTTVSGAQYSQYPPQARIAGTSDVYESMGVMQIKWTTDGNVHAGTEPLRWKSTAWNLDYYGATIRYYYDGACSWCTPGYSAGDQWGSIGGWFNPSPWGDPGALNYIANVQSILANRTWELPGF